MRQFIPSFVIAYSSSEFTNPHEVVLPDEPKDCTADHTHMGVKYWGLETKRHKATSVDENNKCFHYHHAAYNWLQIGFKQRSRLSNLRISTKWFTGNQVRAISVILIDKLTGIEKQILDQESLQPDREHDFQIKETNASECLIKLHYEGGISRINFFGHAIDQDQPEPFNILEKAEISHVSNEHYGNPAMAVFGCRDEMHMKGWESARSGFGEQAIFHLAEPVVINEIIVDTYLHRLNAPLSCHVFGISVNSKSDFEDALNYLPKWTLKFKDGNTIVPKDFQNYMLNQDYLKVNIPDPFDFEIRLSNDDDIWSAVLPFECLSPDTYHRYSDFENEGPFSHLLYMHYPNGGIHGLKVCALIA